jgi:hypothetical protein
MEAITDGLRGWWKPDDFKAAAPEIMLVGEYITNVQDCTGGNPRLLTELHDLHIVPRDCPLAYKTIQFILVFQPRLLAVKTLIMSP